MAATRKQRHRHKRRVRSSRHEGLRKVAHTTPPKTPKHVAPAPAPKKTAPPAAPSSQFRYGGAFTAREAERLLWRAGFGPNPGQAAALAAVGLQRAVYSLTRPAGAAVLTGAAPVDDDDLPIAPYDAWGHDHLWWLDRMVRTSQPFIERMTLIWHDWFATSNDGVNDVRLMLDQNQLFRTRGLADFPTLLLDVTADPAMLLWLNNAENRKNDNNENYARELQELFTLGADRGAYSEDDVRELARALTGFDYDWVEGTGATNFRYVPNRHDDTPKTIYGASGNYSWQDAVLLTVHHPLHPSFFARKLWSYFVPTAPTAATLSYLEAVYKSGGYQIRPVVEAILVHPDLYRGAAMVKPPAVYAAGMLRATARTITTEAWTWRCSQAGQQLFHPPNVSGWDDERWLDTSTLLARWGLAYQVLHEHTYDPEADTYQIDETPAQALEHALAAWGYPTLTADTRAVLSQFAAASMPNPIHPWQEQPCRAMRQNALRHLIVTAPDYHAL